MSSITVANDRYHALNVLLRFGVDIVAVPDPLGLRLDRATRKLYLASRGVEDFPLEDLLNAARILRWRLLVQPQPMRLNSDVEVAIETLRAEAKRVAGGIGDNLADLVIEVRNSVDQLSAYDPPTGRKLLEILDNPADRKNVIVAANERAVSALTTWLGKDGVAVRSAAQLERDLSRWDYAIAIGPPRFFGAKFVTAPRTFTETFVLSEWFTDRTLPKSLIAEYAEGAVIMKERSPADNPPTLDPTPNHFVEEDLLPHVVWKPTSVSSRQPTSDEVIAHVILLSGDLAIYLDEGERIRSFAPDQPDDERVAFTEVSAVKPGIYLLLREGETEHGGLYDDALELLGSRRSDVEASQRQWKLALEERFTRRGTEAVVEQLEACGVQTLERVRAWTEPTLVRPQSEIDFEALLNYLDIPLHPTLEFANDLRRKRSQAGARLRKELESAIAGSKASELELVGHLRLKLEGRGTRGIIATRVLAVSPNAEIVTRSDVRVLFEDRRARWLE